MSVFPTHPSVRLKGSEDSYEPVLCAIPDCGKRSPHLHCPFCVKTDVFHDPVILKAHYRVKHVDKGIDFSGLKILRCCDNCEIVGTIKGQKAFKGAHWHCYKCKNGFNRRDEALKHYKTHFRNPMTTFQIQVQQDINQMMYVPQHVETVEVPSQVGSLAEDGSFYMPSSWIQQQNSAGQPIPASHAQSMMYSNEGVTTQQYSMQNNEQISQVGIAANETIDTGSAEDQHAGYYVIEQGQGDAIMVGDQLNTINKIQSADDSWIQEITQNSNVSKAISSVHSQSVASLAAQVKQEQRNSATASVVTPHTGTADPTAENKDLLIAKYQQQIAKLNQQLDEKEKRIEQLVKREKELLAQIDSFESQPVSEILGDLKSKQEELFNQCMSKLRAGQSPGANSDLTKRILSISKSQHGKIQILNKAVSKDQFSGSHFVTSSNSIALSSGAFTSPASSQLPIRSILVSPTSAAPNLATNRVTTPKRVVFSFASAVSHASSTVNSIASGAETSVVMSSGTAPSPKIRVLSIPERDSGTNVVLNYDAATQQYTLSDDPFSMKENPIVLSQSDMNNTSSQANKQASSGIEIIKLGNISNQDVNFDESDSNSTQLAKSLVGVDNNDITVIENALLYEAAAGIGNSKQKISLYLNAAGEYTVSLPSEEENKNTNTTAGDNSALNSLTNQSNDDTSVILSKILGEKLDEKNESQLESGMASTEQNNDTESGAQQDISSDNSQTIILETTSGSIDSDENDMEVSQDKDDNGQDIEAENVMNDAKVTDAEIQNSTEEFSIGEETNQSENSEQNKTPEKGGSAPPPLFVINKTSPLTPIETSQTTTVTSQANVIVTPSRPKRKASLSSPAKSTPSPSHKRQKQNS